VLLSTLEACFNPFSILKNGIILGIRFLILRGVREYMKDLERLVDIPGYAVVEGADEHLRLQNSKTNP